MRSKTFVQDSQNDEDKSKADKPSPQTMNSQKVGQQDSRQIEHEVPPKVLTDPTTLYEERGDIKSFVAQVENARTLPIKEAQASLCKALNLLAGRLRNQAPKLYCFIANILKQKSPSEEMRVRCWLQPAADYLVRLNPQEGTTHSRADLGTFARDCLQAIGVLGKQEASKTAQDLCQFLSAAFPAKDSSLAAFLAEAVRCSAHYGNDAFHVLLKLALEYTIQLLHEPQLELRREVGERERSPQATKLLADLMGAIKNKAAELSWESESVALRRGLELIAIVVKDSHPQIADLITNALSNTRGSAQTLAYGLLRPTAQYLTEALNDNPGPELLPTQLATLISTIKKNSAELSWESESVALRRGLELIAIVVKDSHPQIADLITNALSNTRGSAQTLAYGLLRPTAQYLTEALNDNPGPELLPTQLATLISTIKKNGAELSWKSESVALRRGLELIAIVVKDSHPQIADLITKALAQSRSGTETQVRNILRPCAEQAVKQLAD